MREQWKIKKRNPKNTFSASPFSTFFDRYNRLRHRFFTYILVFTILQTGLLSPLLYYSINSSVLHASIASQNPSVGALFVREPSMFGYDSTLTKNQNIVFTFLLIGVLLILLIAVILMYFNYIRILYRNKNHLSAATYKLQKLLFKAVYIQMVLAVILLIVPITTSLILTMFGFKWVSKFSLFAFMILSTHAIADFTVLTLFIKPYRVFIIGLIKSSLMKIGFKFKPPTTVTVAPSITSPISITSAKIHVNEHQDHVQE